MVQADNSLVVLVLQSAVKEGLRFSDSPGQQPLTTLLESIVFATGRWISPRSVLL